MALFASARDLQRARGEDEEARVEYVELFFDLVFVFAVTQTSHALLHHLTPAGAIEALLLFMAVWWVWVYTSWVTNWLDPQRNSVRLMLLVLMLAGLILSTSIPAAFGGKGLAFASAYVFMQLGRSLFMMWALRKHNPGNYRNFQRISIWLTVSGIAWIAGGLTQGQARFVLWLIALAIDYISPAAGFRVPGLGRSTTADWDVDGGHLSERCALFVIIALGESVLVTGATFSEMTWNGEHAAAFLVAFIGTVAMWWIYFNIGADYARSRIEKSDDPGAIARVAYTYIHIVIVAGIIVAAVSDELLLAHPTGRNADGGAVLVIAGATLIYIVGNMLFKARVFGRPPLSHMVGAVLSVLLGFVGTSLDLFTLGASSAAILLLVAVWEYLSLKSLRTQAIT
ncbi:MAG TPA: low temperature requirement protein A [Rhizobiaceae bacterium]|nr:low temperature requirement protein A [Rhizobiaceae bacterium]